MATKSLNIKLSVDANQFTSSMGKVNANLRLLKSDLAATTGNVALFGNNLDGLKSKSINLNQQIDQQWKKINLLTEAYQKSAKENGETAEQTQKYERQLNYANAQLSKMQTELADTNTKIREQENSFIQAGNKLQEFSDKAGNVSKTLEKAGSALTKSVTLPIAGLGAGAVKAAIDFEDAFAGVEKTVNGTTEQMAGLNTGIREMATRMPESAVQIAGVAEAAGQLGIKTDSILDFTETMVMLGDSTNLSSDQAATSLARLANITQMPQDQFDRLGSTVVDLGNNFATTESEIVEMGLRLAGAGHQVGMSEAQILGFSTALSSVGIEAEAGGSAFSKVMVEMQLAAETGGESLEQFAEVAGMSASEFSEKFKTDAAGAMIDFIKGLQTCEDRGVSAIKVLDDMGISEVRMRDALLRAAGAGDTFTNAIQTGTKAWDENTALTNEAEKRYQTTASQLKILGNQFVEAGIDIAGEFLPVLKDGVDAAKDFAKFLGTLSDSQKKAMVSALGLAAGIGPVLSIAGKATSGVKTLAEGAGKLAEKFGKAQVESKGLNSGLGLLSKSFGVTGGAAGKAATAFSGVSLGAVGIAAAIPAVLAGLGMWYQHSINVRDGSQAIIDKTQELMSKNNELSANLVANAEQRQTNLQNIENERVSTEGLVSQLYSLVASYGETGNAQTVLQPIIDELNGRIEGLNLSWDNETQSLSLNREEIQKNIEKRAEQIKQQELMNQSVQIYQDLQAAEQQYNDAVAQGQSIHDQQNKILDDAVKKYENLKDGQEKSQLILDYYRVHTADLNKTQLENKNLINESAGKVDSLRGEYEKTLSVMTGEPVRAFERTQQDMFTAGADGLQKYMDGAMGKTEALKQQTEQQSKEAAASARSDSAKQDWSSTGWSLVDTLTKSFLTGAPSFNQTARDVSKGGSDAAKSKGNDYRDAGGLLGSLFDDGLGSQKQRVLSTATDTAYRGRQGYIIGINDARDAEEASGNFVTRMLDKIKNAFGIHSPSTEMEWVGSMAGEGFINGLLESDIGQIAMGIAGNVLEAFDSGNLSLNSFLEALGGGMNGINAFIDFARSNLGEGMSGILDRLAGSFFTGAGNSAVAMTGGLLWPSDYSEITSWFGARPASDTNGIGSTNHGGLDIGAPYGAPIYSAGAGTVTLADWYGGYGNAVMIALDNGFTTLFGHMSSIGVSAGDRVAPGQMVGLVGSTGNSTGPHLHYSIFLNGQPIDPAQFYGFDVGSRRIPFDMPAMVHKDEMIVPARENPYVNSGGSILGGLFDGLDQRIATAVAQALDGRKGGNVNFNQTIVTPEPSPSQTKRQTERLLRKMILD
ncbi:phage tail tape measure protein [Eubacterium sp.]|uniref:phage tail tape measure protein n=1 Tax=Eubacterium sp. TaxID=142586 RepID=UPI0026E09D2A|nr:phage tail tape measure protein [Eubacterium sp.]MDO5434123.1 phage tail tape measure protein [Eubacterium sp.]